MDETIESVFAIALVPIFAWGFGQTGKLQDTGALKQSGSAGVMDCD